MRTHLACVGRVNLGELDGETRRRLEQIETTWLEFCPDPPSLVVRHLQPSDSPMLPSVASELLEFLGNLSESERMNVPGGALYSLDEETGQYVRLKVARGGFLTVAWAQPDYSRARWVPYGGERIPVVLEAYQRLNGTLNFIGPPNVATEIRAVVEQHAGIHPGGEFEARVAQGQVEIHLRDVNSSVLPLLAALRSAANPLSSLEGEIDVSSFRPGDLEDYCRFVLRGGESWLVRPSLWVELPQDEAAAPRALEPAA